MAGELILLDTSILVDYFRKANKQNSDFYQLVAARRYAFAVSVITEYEIYVGATGDQIGFWDTFFSRLRSIGLDSQSAKEAVNIQSDLKKQNKMIAIPDLLIGATARSKRLKLATKNKEHFQRIADLDIL
jgi:predicted nucleic acid-binding protein